jgi:hypothetical protein
MANKNILLIEPGYKNKYPPLGLMKIAAYHGPFGKRDTVKFVKGEGDRSVLNTVWDRIYVTSLFSFEWKTISEAIDWALIVSQRQPSKVFVGGIAASLMHSAYQAEPKWRGIRFIKGLLSQPPATALQLDDVSEELYSEDIASTPIEDLIPDYSILDQIGSQYRYPVHDAYFAYASRGCVRKCHFCGVPKLEGAQRDAASLTDLVHGIDNRYGPRRDLMLMDNNVAASANYRNIIAEIRDLGFIRGAMFKRPGMRTAVQRRVDFNQGVDARILTKDKMYLQEMSTICLKPLRIAFDNIGYRKVYEQSIRFAHEFGLDELSNYMLYNFHDNPADLYARMRLNIDLNEELGIRIFSFPMRYQPTDLKDRSHIGENWNRLYLRSMQTILQATHGIVSGSPDFFRRAFGESEDAFAELLSRPERFLFNRVWYEDLGGKAEFEQYQTEWKSLAQSERGEVIGLISSSRPAQFTTLLSQASSTKVASMLRWYVPIPKDDEAKIWARVREQRLPTPLAASIPDDELVEDAGLAEVA